MAIVEQQARKGLYESDRYAWSQRQAELLREHRFAELDLDNLIDEVASVGGSEKRELRSRFVVLVAHLLKWRFQPGARSGSWAGTVVEQRDQIAAILDQSPSLKGFARETFASSWRAACLLASKETGIDLTLFPEEPCFEYDRVVDMDFWPEEPDLFGNR